MPAKKPKQTVLETTAPTPEIRILKKGSCPTITAAVFKIVGTDSITRLAPDLA